MSDKDSVDRSNLGRNMGLAFRYVQQIFKETAQLMIKLDNLMGKNWKPTYGNRTTKEVTSHIEKPEGWLVEASFRIYDSKSKPNIKRGITVAYWSEDIEEPILIAGKMDYLLNKKTGEPKNQDHWDLWNAWFAKDYEMKKIDGTVYETKLESDDELIEEIKDHIKEAKVFAIPLAHIRSEDDIEKKVYEKLMTL